MTNLFSGRPNVVTAKQTISFVNAGITALNTAIIYQVGDGGILSYVPGRSINGITGFIQNRGYYIYPLVDMDLSPYLTPPGEWVEPVDGTTGNNAYFFGDSITLGVTWLPDPPTQRWAHLVCASLGLTEHNLAIDGTAITTNPPNTCNGGAFTHSMIPVKTNADRFLFIAYGTNDMLASGVVNTTLYQSALVSAITDAVSKGWSPLRIIVVSVYFSSKTTAFCGGPDINETTKLQFVDAAKQASAVFGNLFIPMYQVMKDNGGSSFNVADGLHLNESGHAYVAGVIEAAM